MSGKPKTELLKEWAYNNPPDDYKVWSALLSAIDALGRYERDGCEWCDATRRDRQVVVGVRAKNYFGAPTFERDDVEYNYCPFCNKQMEW